MGLNKFIKINSGLTCIIKLVNKHYCAFTLAEVLITLSIVGVVAALTIPSVIQNKNDRETVSRLKKVYSSLSQAYSMLSQEHGDPTNWGIVSANDGNPGTSTPEGAASSINLANMFAKHMRVIKNCGTDRGCFSKDTSVDTRADVGKILLNDGAALAFAGLNGNCDNYRGDTKQLSSVCAWIIVDINGNRSPNTYGIDIFEFMLTKYGVVPYGIFGDTGFPFDTDCKNFKLSSDVMHGCTAWVLFNENLDYRKCSDLGWDTKTKCK